jgi:hypothetical protein
MPTTTRTRKKQQEEATGRSVQVSGFYRLMMRNVRTGKKVYTPWRKNVITADGFQSYIVQSIGSGLTGKLVSHMQLATQTAAPTSSQTSATGEFEARKAVTNSFVANGTLRATASWNTNEATQSAVGAVALYNTSSAGTAGSIATFTASTKTTDQTLNVTYEWRFS